MTRDKTRRRSHLDEGGFTLIELLVVLAILPLVVGGVAAALITSLRTSAAVQSRISDSHDAQITSAYFVRDVQSASQIETAPTPLCTDPTSAGPSTQLLGLVWSSGATTDVVSYVSTTIGTPRTVADGVTSSSTMITSVTAQFGAADVGSLVGGSPDIPVGAFVMSVTDATTAVLSVPATGTDAGQTFEIGTYPALKRWFCQVAGQPKPTDFPLTTQVPASIVSHGLGETRTVTNGTTNSTTTITSPEGFSPADVGSFVTSPHVPAGTSIVSVSDPSTAILSASATAGPSGQTFQLVPALTTLSCNDFYDSNRTSPPQPRSSWCKADAATGLVSTLDVSSVDLAVSDGSPRRFTYSLDAVPRVAQFNASQSIIGAIPPLLLGSGISCAPGSGSITVYGPSAVDSSSSAPLQFGTGTLRTTGVYSPQAVVVSPPGAYAGPLTVGPALSNPYQNLPQPPSAAGPSTYTYANGEWTPDLPDSQPSTLPTFVFDDGGGPGSGPIRATDLDHGTLFSGIYIFSGDLSGLSSDPGGVFLDDLASGAITITGNGDLNISALTNPPNNTPYTGIALLVPSTTSVTMTGNGSTDAVDGVVVAPAATVNVSGNGHVDVLGLVASSVSCIGDGNGVFGPQPSAMDLSSSANPSRPGQNVTFTATVNESSGGNLPTGTVTFTVTPANSSAVVPCSDVPLSNGSASCSMSSLFPSGAPYTVVATYVSDNGADQNATQRLLQYVPWITTTSVSGPGPIVSGQSAVFTATVAAGAPPIGTVTFRAAPSSGPPITLCSSVNVSGGTAQCTTNTLLAADSPYTITAAFTPQDPNSFVASSGTKTQSVNRATTTTSVDSSANPSVFGQTVTYSATVSVDAPGSGTPSGTVTFDDGGSPLACNSGSQAFGGTGATCVVTYTALFGSPHAITATFSGDGSYTGSTSAMLSQVVNVSPTATNVSSSRNPRRSGRSVTFTATVAATGGGSGTPAGTVTFTETPSGSSTPVPIAGCSDIALSGGVASCTTRSLVSAGSPYAITASFTDTDGVFSNSSDTLIQTMT